MMPEAKFKIQIRVGSSWYIESCQGVVVNFFDVDVNGKGSCDVGRGGAGRVPFVAGELRRFSFSEPSNTGSAD